MPNLDFRIHYQKSDDVRNEKLQDTDQLQITMVNFVMTFSSFFGRSNLILAHDYIPTKAVIIKLFSKVLEKSK